MSMPDKDWPKRLLSWFDANKRDLPWRESKPRNPYHVWVSEIMLQQTRTEAVKPYYESWMARFPTIKDLADADEQDVLHQWQGLGYYSRARNLHKAAREMEEKYGSEMPDTADEVRALPGIGDYTAGAILSIAFGKKEPAVDGNVLRVYARLYGIEDDVLKTAGRKKIRTLCEETIPERAGDFNEALMDLGANVCIPKRPRCSMCPLSSYCLALKEGREEELPVRGKKQPPKEFYAACAICIMDGKVLLHKRPATGMLASMWEFPMVLSEKADTAADELSHFLHVKLEGPVWKYKHVFTHRIWYMNAYMAENITVPEGEYKYFSPEEYKEIPLAGPHARLAAFAEKLISDF